MSRALLVPGLLAAAMALAGPAAAADPAPVGPPPAHAWADLAKLPDWGGIWTSILADQVARFDSEPPPWTPSAAARIAAQVAADKAGHPDNFYLNCLPEGMPGFVLITRNAFEFLFTPGRVTVLGEMDGNRLRRIWTDGRGHPDDPDPSFHGDSIGHWEGETLVVDTVGILPEVILPISQSAGVANNGDMHVVERIHLVGEELHDDLVITAPHVLTAPWKTTRIFRRQRGPGFDIAEASCRQGDFTESTDKNGDAIFAPLPRGEGGAPIVSEH